MSFIGNTSAEANTVSPPSHVAGDTLVAIVARHGSATAPSIPAGWLVMQNRGVTTGTATRCLIVAVKIAATAAETFGTWTNATHVMCAVYRDANILVGGGSVGSGQNATTSVQYIALVGQSALSANPNRFAAASSLLLAATYVTDNGSAITTPPTGMSHRATLTGATTGRLVLHDTNGAVGSWSLQTVAVATTDSVTVLAELADSGCAKSSGSGGASRLINGGLVRGQVL
jgi:hypothetical protein